MGYFSNFKIDYDEDDSYPSPDRQLMWRLEDLRSRLEELKEIGAPLKKDEGLRLTDDDIRYAIPEYFEGIADIERAIDLAINDLYLKYDIDVVAESADDEQLICCIPSSEQLCFDELKIIESYNEPPKVA